MVKIEEVRSSNSTLIETQPLVAVFVGGTSGIGAQAVCALARTHADTGKGLRIYIVGRKAAPADKIIADCVKVCPGGQFRFVKADDLALLGDVDRVCAEIIRLEEVEKEKGGIARIDLLVTSAHSFNLLFKPRNETKEGLDMNLSLLYYARMRFILKLLPLLLASSLPAHAVSIYGAGKEGKFLPNDLTLRDPQQYGQATVRSHVVHMTTFFMEGLAERYRGRLSLVHIFPGLVITDSFKDPSMPTWFKVIWPIAQPLMKPMSTPPAECGERILFLATPRFPARPVNDDKTIAADKQSAIALGSDGIRGSGAYAIYSDSESISTEKAYKKLREEDVGRKVWDHTMKAFEEIEAGKVFTG